jgi:hypothetical protein
MPVAVSSGDNSNIIAAGGAQTFGCSGWWLVYDPRRAEV